jgi:hypothetical protein
MSGLVLIGWVCTRRLKANGKPDGEPFEDPVFATNEAYVLARSRYDWQRVWGERAIRQPTPFVPTPHPGPDPMSPETREAHIRALQCLRDAFGAGAANTRDIAALETAIAALTWRTMDSAPKDGTDILVYREDAGVFMASWYAAQDRMTDADIERECRDADARGESTDWLEQEDWFCGQGFRLEGDEVPTHWMPLPDPPAAIRTSMGEAGDG